MDFQLRFIMWAAIAVVALLSLYGITELVEVQNAP